MVSTLDYNYGRNGDIHKKISNSLRELIVLFSGYLLPPVHSMLCQLIYFLTDVPLVSDLFIYGRPIGSFGRPIGSLSDLIYSWKWRDYVVAKPKPGMGSSLHKLVQQQDDGTM